MEETLPSPEEFLLKVAPWQRFKFAMGQYQYLMRLQFFSGALDTFCVDCGRESVFQSKAPPLQVQIGSGAENVTVEFFLENAQLAAWWPDEPGPRHVSQMIGFATADRTFDVPFSCTRNTAHTISFVFRVDKLSLTKIGQYPSMADMARGELKRYRGSLDDRHSNEFMKAVGLHAHGVGVGSFVYLRRIFEDLIGDAHQRAKGRAGWDDLAFSRGRMDERIALLKDELPSFLVENRALYSILSSGIHELSEQQCLDAFETVKLGIELILDERIAQKERQQKIEHAKKGIEKLRSGIKGG